MLVEMSVGLLATVLNVIVLATIKNSSRLLAEPAYVLLANVSVSNIVTSVFVKLMSVIVCGHAVAVGRAEVPFQFCSLMLFTQRMAWSVLPSTLLVLPWVALLPRLLLLSSAWGREEEEEECPVEAVLTQRWELLKAQEVVTLLRARSQERPVTGWAAVRRAARANRTPRATGFTKQKSKSMEDKMEEEVWEGGRRGQVEEVEERRSSCSDLAAPPHTCSPEAPSYRPHVHPQASQAAQVCQSSQTHRRLLFAKSRSQAVSRTESLR